MTSLYRYFCGVLLAVMTLAPPAVADDRPALSSGGPGQTGTIQSLDLGAGKVRIDGRSYALASTLKVYTPGGRQVDPAILQHERHIRFTTAPGTAVVTEIRIVQAD